MEKQLLNSFFIRFDNYANQKYYNNLISLNELIEIKQSAKIVFNSENINSVFNTHTSKLFNIIKKHI